MAIRLCCSFCGKDQDRVEKLIAGPGVYICNECVELCLEILDEEKGTRHEGIFKYISTDISDLKEVKEVRDKEQETLIFNAISPLQTDILSNRSHLRISCGHIRIMHART